MQVQQATSRPYETEKALVDRVFFFDKDEPKESSTNWTSVIQVDLIYHSFWLCAHVYSNRRWSIFSWR